MDCNRIQLDNINEIFKIPIFFNEDTKILDSNVINDLELVTTKEENEQPIYNHIFIIKHI